MRDPYGQGAPTAEVLREIIEAGQAAGEFTTGADPQVASLVLFDAYIGVITRWFAATPAERFDLSTALRQVLAAFLHGVARKPAE